MPGDPMKRKREGLGKHLGGLEVPFPESPGKNRSRAIATTIGLGADSRGAGRHIHYLHDRRKR